jgi:hypothetical protein
VHHRAGEGVPSRFSGGTTVVFVLVLFWIWLILVLVFVGLAVRRLLRICIETHS